MGLLSHLDVYTYKKLQKDKSAWYYICCLQKELPYWSTDNNALNEFKHEILSSNTKFISIVLKQSEYFDEEILEKIKNKYISRIQ